VKESGKIAQHMPFYFIMPLPFTKIDGYLLQISPSYPTKKILVLDYVIRRMILFLLKKDYDIISD
jgi:hypothetical protein